jgi:O-antigen ligase
MTTRRDATGLPWLDRVGVALVLLLPFVLLHGRVLAEADLVLLSLLFLLQSVLRRDWQWVRRTWVRIAFVWWAWVVLCSALHGLGAVGQAAGVARFLLGVAALEHWVLRQDRVRRWLTWLLQGAAAYLAAQCLLQFATGRNLYGYGRGADGELTGPYQNPRAGAPLSRLLFPAVLPWMERFLTRGMWYISLFLLPAGVAVMVLIGQRMPLLLTIMGLFVTALFLPRLRQFVMIACIAAGALVSATSVISPPTFNRLVTKFSSQMEGFQRSHYGLIAERAVLIAEAQPFVGVGFDGFRRECERPAYFRGVGGDGGGAAMCVQHPHNFYLQALVEGGIPGLVLFGAVAFAWLMALLQGLWQSPDPLRVGLFVAALIHLWPIASSTAFTSMPQSGWFFVLLGLGLAETQHHIISRNRGA